MQLHKRQANDWHNNTSRSRTKTRRTWQRERAHDAVDRVDNEPRGVLLRHLNDAGDGLQLHAAAAT
jgi:hypothetical protein